MNPTSKFREARVLLTGEGESFRTLVRALLKMGLRAPVIVEADDTQLRQLLQEWKEQDKELELKRVAYGRESRWLRAQTELPELVVNVSDKYKESAVNALTETCAELGIPLLVGTQLHDSEWVAQLRDGKAATGWDGLIDPFEMPSDRSEGEEAPNFHLMIGNVAALETFKRLNGLDSLR